MRAKLLKDLARGDKVVSGLYYGDWMKGTKIVDRVEITKMRSYRRITFSDGTSTSAHSQTPVTIESAQ